MPIATSWLECSTRNSGYRWSIFLSTVLPLMNWIPPIWPSFPFLLRSTCMYSTCLKTKIGTRHPQRSQTLPKEFTLLLHTSSPQRMRSQTHPFLIHCQWCSCHVPWVVLARRLGFSQFIRVFLVPLPCIGFPSSTEVTPTIYHSLFWTSHFYRFSICCHIWLND